MKQAQSTATTAKTLPQEWLSRQQVEAAVDTQGCEASPNRTGKKLE